MYLSKIKVKEAMEAKGIKTFTDLANILGITKNQLSVMMSDSYNPFKMRVEELCRVLDISPDVIMDFEHPQDRSKNTNMVKESDITAIELFAGAGGLALGLEKAGIKTLEYVEFDKACCETLRTNRPEWNVICDDIHNVDFTAFRDKVDIVTGGFPCQAFSFAGKNLDLMIPGELFFMNLLVAYRKFIRKYSWRKMFVDWFLMIKDGRLVQLLAS